MLYCFQVFFEVKVQNIDRPSFIVDQNAGQLARLLRLLGFDAVYFCGKNDSQLVNIAVYEKRVILTRDTHILERRLVKNGLAKAILIEKDVPIEQIGQVIREMALSGNILAFYLCIECNRRLVRIEKSEIGTLVPEYVLKTQTEFTQCPHCHRIYWKGTHWKSMSEKIQKIAGILK
jgi:hypothetical protein